MLRARVKFGTAQKSIEKALNTAAGQAGMPMLEIEEISVPAYGLQEVGVRRAVWRVRRRAGSHGY
jgi:hypothetical protein